MKSLPPFFVELAAAKERLGGALTGWLALLSASLLAHI
jgi:hypothetical protein